MFLFLIIKKGKKVNEKGEERKEFGRVYLGYKQKTEVGVNRFILKREFDKGSFDL